MFIRSSCSAFFFRAVALSLSLFLNYYIHFNMFKTSNFVQIDQKYSNCCSIYSKWTLNLFWLVIEIDWLLSPNVTVTFVINQY